MKSLHEEMAILGLALTELKKNLAKEIEKTFHIEKLVRFLDKLFHD